MKHAAPGIMFAALLSLGTTASLAGDPPAAPPADELAVHRMHGHARTPPTAEEMTRHMQEELGLSPEQVEKVRAICEQHLAQMEKIRSDHDKAMKDVLSAEQYEKFRKSREEHEAKMHELHHGGHPH